MRLQVEAIFFFYITHFCSYQPAVVKKNNNAILFGASIPAPHFINKLTMSLMKMKRNSINLAHTFYKLDSPENLILRECYFRRQ